MPKTYCFIYRRFGWQDPATIYVKACGWVQAVGLARDMLKSTLDVVDWACFPARRGAIRHCIYAMTPDYKGGCN